MVLEDTAGSEQALGSLPGHRRAAAVPVQNSMGVNLVSRGGSHLGCQLGGEATKGLFSAVCA